MGIEQTGQTEQDNAGTSGLSKTEILRLLEAARDVRLRAYAPYSKFQVGAAALAPDGQIFGGCNVENASYPLCLCAERIAIGGSISAGAGAPVAIAVVTENAGTPCGACRQVLAEINANMLVFISTISGTDYRTTTAAQLLPDRFELPPPA
jgi:cytidine deaminase